MKVAACLTLTLSVATFLSGCAAETQSRRVAGSSAAMLNDYRREVDRFAAGQTALNADIDRRVRSLNAVTARLRSDNHERIGALRAIDDKHAIILVDQFSGPLDDSSAGSRVLEDMKPRSPAESVKFDASKVQNVVKQLNNLNERPNLLARIEAIDAYWASLREAYEKSIADAAAQAQQTAPENAEAHEQVLAGQPSS
jgi:hypothetical protein